MTSMQDMIKRDIKKYTDFGYSLEGAVRQVKGMRRGSWDAQIDQVYREIKK